MKELKLAELGYQIATCCDYVPEYSKEEAEDLSINILEDCYQIEDISTAMKKYEGHSDGDMASVIMRLIKEL